MASYLTKSKFKVGTSCPTKLFYQARSKEYANISSSDPFLAALAEGGFQVGELAKVEFEDGIEVTETAHESAWQTTKKLLEQDKVTIFEAAILFENCFVRVDVLKKSGTFIELIEVKSKTFDANKEDQFLAKRVRKDGLHELKSNWEPYLVDVAFQTYVMRKAFPQYSVEPYLMLANKNSKASVDGLNQKFFLTKDGKGRTCVETEKGVTKQSIGESILCKVNVQEYVELVLEDKVVILDDNLLGVCTFSKVLAHLQKAIDCGKKIETAIGKKCKSCEFKTKDSHKAEGLKSGFDECWSTALRQPLKGNENFVFDVWSWAASDSQIENGVHFFEQVDTSLFEEVTDIDSLVQFSRKQRPWLQVTSHVNKSSDEYVIKHSLTQALASFQYPLHFIDFETSGTAVPFFKGYGPYSQVAFQFSHHVMNIDGSIEHAGQYFCDVPGKFPNFDFIRELKKQLSKDSGTIFRYAAHENSILNTIAQQLHKSEEPDRDELVSWISSITEKKDADGETIFGRRSMVDMCELVKSYYYSPLMKGSNSIKKVLPATLNHSPYLQERYSKPIYGKSDGIKSLNYSNWTWIELKDGKVIDPYKKLPKVFEDGEFDDDDLLSNSNDLADGGAAMTAYAKMQFTRMTEFERRKLMEALLKYCELDTLAMVMIFEHWLYELAAPSTYKKKAV